MGTGRVMSQIRMQAVLLPLASSASGGRADGSRQRGTHCVAGRRQHRHGGFPDHVDVEIVREVERKSVPAVVQIDPHDFLSERV